VPEPHGHPDHVVPGVAQLLHHALEGDPRGLLRLDAGGAPPIRLEARAQDAEIRIGAVLPVTGKESKIGGAYKLATELAVKEVNDAGGLAIGGKKLKIDLKLLDDTSDPSKSAQLVSARARCCGVETCPDLQLTATSNSATLHFHAAASSLI